VPAERRVPLLCLDLDGTVRHGKDELGHFVNHPEDVVVFGEAAELMRRWKQAGGRIIGVSNQGGIALGHLTMRDCALTMARTQPGLVVEAALKLAARHGEAYPPYMGLLVGDRDEDAECARLAGFDFAWAKDWRAQATGGK
jgi:D-glycero-D-manno-heptose 1,7-bisphosphate phosphatase